MDYGPVWTYPTMPEIEGNVDVDVLYDILSVTMKYRNDKHLFGYMDGSN